LVEIRFGGESNFYQNIGLYFISNAVEVHISILLLNCINTVQKVQPSQQLIHELFLIFQDLWV